MPAWIWLIGAAALAAAEALGAEFFLLMLGVGALAGAATALVAPDLLWLQLIVFAVVSVLMVVLARPALIRRFHVTATASGIEALIGARASVVSSVDANGGLVKIGGEVWSAVGADGHQSMPPGTPVTVVEIRGATAVVTWGQ